MSKQEGKVFIGGLSWETTDEKLRRYFENFGTVQEAFVSYDRNTGRPRGFGFVVFADPIIADRVTQQQHTIDRREVEAKKALPKEESPVSKDAAASAVGQRTRKVFVGGLPPSVDEGSLRAYFGEWGCVEDAVVMYDHENRRPRGFGFITYTEEDSVERVFAHGAIHTLHDKPCEVKRAVPRDSMPVSPRGAAGAAPGFRPPSAPSAPGGVSMVYGGPAPGAPLLYQPTPDRPPYADAPRQYSAEASRQYGGRGGYGGGLPRGMYGYSGRGAGGMQHRMSPMAMQPGMYNSPAVVTGIPASMAPGHSPEGGMGLQPGSMTTPTALGPQSPLSMGGPGLHAVQQQLIGGSGSGGSGGFGQALPGASLSAMFAGALDPAQQAAAQGYAELAHAQHAQHSQQQAAAAAAALSAAMEGMQHAQQGAQQGQQTQQATIWS